MSRLFNKSALVTGAGSGIGEAIARRFAREGAHVVAVDRDAQKVKTVVTQIREQGHSAEAHTLDLTDDAELRSFVELMVQVHEAFGVLVNNAGVGHVGSVLQTSDEDLDRLYAVNVKAPFRIVRAFLPGMLLRQSGSIINIASIGGVIGLIERAAYCTTKFAIVGLTKAMALDHAPDKVRVNCVCPGRVETPFLAARIAEYSDPQKAYRELSSSHPLGRMARPEEVAAAVVYLASDESAFVTGSALVIDGGMSAGK